MIFLLKVYTVDGFTLTLKSVLSNSIISCLCVLMFLKDMCVCIDL